jgi:hypothetical protein
MTSISSILTQAAQSASSSLKATSSSSTQDTSSDLDSAEKIKLSNFAKLLAALDKLEQNDPAKFKKVLQEAADKFKSLAKAAGEDTVEGKRLSALADKFSQAAQAGDLTALMPPPPPPRVERTHPEYREYPNQKTAEDIEGVLSQVINSL